MELGKLCHSVLLFFQRARQSVIQCRKPWGTLQQKQVKAFANERQACCLSEERQQT
jgi:hypothetical protein